VPLTPAAWVWFASTPVALPGWPSRSPLRGAFLTKNIVRSQLGLIMAQNITTQRKQLSDFIADMRSIKTTELEDMKLALTIYVEGNLASGKTSFLNHFQNIPNLIVLPEPIEKWQNFKGMDLLKLKYEEGDKYEFMFQVYANMTRIEQLNNYYHQKTIKIWERSIQSSFAVFVKNSKDNYKMGELPYEVLKHMHDTFTSGAMQVLTCPDLVIYLQTEPSTCMERLTSRKREGERTVDKEYLENIHVKHELWLNDKTSERKLGCPIVIIDGNQSTELMKNEAQKTIQIIKRLATEKMVIESLARNRIIEPIEGVDSKK